MPYTITTIGSTAADYTKVSLWDSGTDAATSNQEGQLQNEVHTEATTSVTIAGATVLRRLTCVAGAFHTRKRLTGAQTSGFRVISSETGFEIIRTSHRIIGGGSTLRRINLTGANQVVDGCLVTDAESAVAGGIYASGSSTGAIVRNCIVFGVSQHGIAIDTGAVSGSVMNCTIGNCGKRGITMVGTDDLRCQNNISCGNRDPVLDPNEGGDIAGYSDVTHRGWNITSYAIAGGSEATDTISTLGNQITTATAGSEDGTLLLNASAVWNGIDLSDLFTTDCDGATRLVPWSIGADDPGIIPTIKTHLPMHGTVKTFLPMAGDSGFSTS